MILIFGWVFEQYTSPRPTAALVDQKIQAHKQCWSSGYRRTIFHIQIYFVCRRVCNANGEFCLRRGTNKRCEEMPLHSFRSAMRSARKHVPTTAGGTPIISSDFDPYRGSFMAPDHLLTGHFRDCLSLGLKLLPSKEYIVHSERSIIRLLQEAGLPSQSLLVNLEKKSLYNMSMTDLYAISMVGEIGFVRGCRTQQLEGPN